MWVFGLSTVWSMEPVHFLGPLRLTHPQKLPCIGMQPQWTIVMSWRDSQCNSVVIRINQHHQNASTGCVNMLRGLAVTGMIFASPSLEQLSHLALKGIQNYIIYKFNPQNGISWKYLWNNWPILKYKKNQPQHLQIPTFPSFPRSPRLSTCAQSPAAKGVSSDWKAPTKVEGNILQPHLVTPFEN